MAALLRPECADFLQFQDILKNMRLIDDRIIHALNVQLPTESFKAEKDCQSACKELFETLEKNYKDRELAINNCLEFSSRRVSELRAKKSNNENDVNVSKELRKEQAKVRLLQTEQGVEEIIRERTTKAVYERCRLYYVPKNFQV